MTYHRTILTRWSRRDLLSVVIIALAVAFLTGTALLLVTASAQTTAIAADYGANASVTAHDSLQEARAEAEAAETVVPFALVREGDGTRSYVLSHAAITDVPTVADDGGGVSGGNVSSGDVTAPESRQLRGGEGTVETTVRPRGDGFLPPSWYVAPRAVVDRLGVSGAFVVHEAPDGTLPRVGAPVRAALPFFVFGTAEAIDALAVVALGSAVLVAVIVYSVTRMTVRDRRRTIRVIRATGGSPGAVLGLFGARATLLTVTGVLLGYAVGVIAVNAAINLAVFLGLGTTLSATLTPAAAWLIGAGALVIVLVGAVSGALATVPAVRRDVASIMGTTRRRTSRLSEWLSLSVLDVRTLVPAIATLTVFAAFVVLLAGIAGVVAPLTGTGATITEPGSTHPIASSLPQEYAAVVRDTGVPASPEILLFEASDGQPYVARGVNYSAFTSVTDSAVTAGRPPDGPDEAVVGASLARTLGVSVGDEVTVGGSTRAGVDRVRIVGRFTAPSPYDDQLLVSLPTAQHLTGRGPGQVHFIRTERLPDADRFQGQARAQRVDLDAPGVVPPDETVTVRVTVRNDDADATTETLAVDFGDQRVQRDVTVPANGNRTVAVQFDAPSPGQYDLTAESESGGRTTRRIEVASRDALRVGPVPDRLPPNSTLRVAVRTPYGDPVANATVSLGEQSVRTDADGYAWLPVRGEGEETLVVTGDGEQRRRTVTVSADAVRRPRVQAAVSPDRPDLLTRPAVSVTLENPWNATLKETVTVEGPGETHERTVEILPGGTETVEMPLARQSPGEYTVGVRTARGAVTALTYGVTGDERVASAIASGGAAGQSGIGRAIEAAFGNLQVVLAVIFGLATLMTVGGMTATFARAVHARRGDLGIYRATGAAPTRVARLVLGDALVLGVVAAGLALLCGLAAVTALDWVGYLTVFGVRLSAIPSPAVVAGTFAGGVLVTFVGAGLVVARLLLAAPHELLGGSRVDNPPSRDTGGDGP